MSVSARENGLIVRRPKNKTFELGKEIHKSHVQTHVHENQIERSKNEACTN